MKRLSTGLFLLFLLAITCTSCSKETMLSGDVEEESSDSTSIIITFEAPDGPRQTVE